MNNEEKKAHKTIVEAITGDEVKVTVKDGLSDGLGCAIAVIGVSVGIGLIIVAVAYAFKLITG